MTHADAIMDGYQGALHRLLMEMRHVARIAARAPIHEPEPPERVQLCEARKLDQLARAQESGLLRWDPIDA